MANGVKGIGHEGSKVALFESEDGERGLVCEEPISAGEVVLEVPLRLALTDHPGDEESNALLYEGAPWSVRLACKLLRNLAAGDRSPWAPYIKVLPRHVPAPLESFSWEDITSLRYPAAQEALHTAGWLAADSFLAACEEARGGLGEDAFRWALSVVHSRTFANAAPGGGVGVRMLVPLVDMLNHGGDVAAEGALGLGLGLGLGGGRVVATDNVRWDLLSPARSTTGGWAMAVSATRDLEPGQEVLLSYGERPNDDFFLHYGFVPRANPHDDAVLWPDLEAALEWHYERLGAQKLSREAAEPLYLEALEAGRREHVAELRQLQQRSQQQSQQGGGEGGSREGASRGGGSGSGSGGGRGGGGDGGGGGPVGESHAQSQDGPQLPPEVARQLAQIKVVAGGQVSASVMHAFAAVSGGDAAAAGRAVALRCAEMLCDMAGRPGKPGTPVGFGASAGGVAGASASTVGADAVDDAGVRCSCGGGILAELARLLVDADPRVAVVDASAAAAAVEPEGVDARYWAEQLRGYCAVLVPRFVELLPEGAAAAAAAVTAAASTAAASTATSVSAEPSRSGALGTSAGAGAGGGLKSKYGLPPPASASPAPAPAPAPPAQTDGAVPLGALVRALLPAAAAAEPGASGLRLTGPQRLSAAFLVHKQMVLWDVLLGSDVPGADLAAFVRDAGQYTR